MWQDHWSKPRLLRAFDSNAVVVSRVSEIKSASLQRCLPFLRLLVACSDFFADFIVFLRRTQRVLSLFHGQLNWLQLVVELPLSQTELSAWSLPLTFEPHRLSWPVRSRIICQADSLATTVDRYTKAGRELVSSRGAEKEFTERLEAVAQIPTYSQTSSRLFLSIKSSWQTHKPLMQSCMIFASPRQLNSTSEWVWPPAS